MPTQESGEEGPPQSSTQSTQSCWAKSVKFLICGSNISVIVIIVVLVVLFRPGKGSGVGVESTPNMTVSEIKKLFNVSDLYEPRELQHVILEKSTGTSLQFRFVAPTDTGGLPIESYAVEYKEASQDWDQANRRWWPANQVGGYILEDLQPETTYDLQFACKNRVGFSSWGSGQQITTPKRGRPEPPILNRETGDGEIVDGDIIKLPTTDHYEVSWRIPEDNGVPIDYYLLTYYPVRKETTSFGDILWRQIGDIKRVEIPFKGNVQWNLQLEYQDTFYKVELMAHNQLGFSPESVLIIKNGHDGTSGGTPIQSSAYIAPI